MKLDSNHHNQDISSYTSFNLDGSKAKVSSNPETTTEQNTLGFYFESNLNESLAKILKVIVSKYEVTN